MLTHKAVLSTISGIEVLLEELGQKLGSDDVYLSFLPLAHIFDRVVEELFLSLGGSIGYFQVCRNLCGYGSEKREEGEQLSAKQNLISLPGRCKEAGR